MLTYYLITGKDNGISIEPYVIAIKADTHAGQKRLDDCLNTWGDSVRYYEKITCMQAKKYRTRK